MQRDAADLAGREAGRAELPRDGGATDGFVFGADLCGRNLLVAAFRAGDTFRWRGGGNSGQS